MMLSETCRLDQDEADAIMARRAEEVIEALEEMVAGDSVVLDMMFRRWWCAAGLCRSCRTCCIDGMLVVLSPIGSASVDGAERAVLPVGVGSARRILSFIALAPKSERRACILQDSTQHPPPAETGRRGRDGRGRVPSGPRQPSQRARLAARSGSGWECRARRCSRMKKSVSSITLPACLITDGRALRPCKPARLIASENRLLHARTKVLG
eukprot:1704078-Rhodomonas_salina.2